MTSPISTLFTSASQPSTAQMEKGAASLPALGLLPEAGHGAPSPTKESDSHWGKGDSLAAAQGQPIPGGRQLRTCSALPL
jgi:hypothetical protein